MKSSSMFLIMVACLAVCQMFADREPVKIGFALMSAFYFVLFFISAKQESE